MGGVIILLIIYLTQVAELAEFCWHFILYHIPWFSKCVFFFDQCSHLFYVCVRESDIAYTMFRAVVADMEIQESILW